MKARLGAGATVAAGFVAVMATGVRPIVAAEPPATTTTDRRLEIHNLTVNLAQKGGIQVGTEVEPGSLVDEVAAAVVGTDFRLFLPIQPIGPVPGVTTNVGIGGAGDADVHTKVTREECLKQGGTVRPDGRCDAGYWDEFAFDLEA